MSAEQPGSGPEQNQPRILDTVMDAEGNAIFRITPDVRGVDVLATLDYHQQDPAERIERVDRMLRFAVEERQVLAGRSIRVNDPVQPASDAITMERALRIAPGAKYADIKQTITAIYGDETAPRLRSLLARLVDIGAFEKGIVKMESNNELIVTNDDQIAAEMDKMTRNFYNGEDL